MFGLLTDSEFDEISQTFAIFLIFLVSKNSVFQNPEFEALENLNLSYKYWNHLSLFNYHYESFLFFLLYLQTYLFFYVF